MILTLLKIRLLQLSRTLQGIGFGRVLFLILIALFVGFLVVKAAWRYPIWLATINFGIIALIHYQRADLQFLKRTIVHSQLLFISEYLLLSLPVLASLLFFKMLIIALLSIVTTVLISIIEPIKLKYQSLNILTKLLPGFAFELKSGIRKTEKYIIVLYLIGLATLFHEAGAPIIIFILSIFPLNFFEKGEPLELLFAKEMSAPKLINFKIIRSLKYYILVIIPLISLYATFHPELWYIPVIETILFSIIIIYTIVLKYAFYLPNEKNAAAQTFLSLGILGIFIPILIPLVIILILYFYQKALQNLKPYLNDYTT